MKTPSIFGLIGIMLIFMLLTSCGKNKVLEESSNLKETKAIEQAIEVGKMAQDIKPINADSKPEEIAQSIEKFAEIGATLEVKEFEKISSVDTPDNFPKEFIYNKGKVVNASDNGTSEKDISQSIDIKTLESINDVKAFYKTALSAQGWKISNQSNASNGGSFSANKTDGSSVDIDISGNEYSKITEIQIQYVKSANP